MKTRKQLIEEIMANINAMKHKMHVKMLARTHGNKITHSQWFVLSLIEAKQNMGIKEIAATLGITSSATTQLVDGLVQQGYVVRNTNIHDARALQLRLSPKGKTRITAMKKEFFRTMAVFFEALSDEELKTYCALHKKILTNAS